MTGSERVSRKRANTSRQGSRQKKGEAVGIHPDNPARLLPLDCSAELRPEGASLHEQILDQLGDCARLLGAINLLRVRQQNRGANREAAVVHRLPRQKVSVYGQRPLDETELAVDLAPAEGADPTAVRVEDGRAGRFVVRRWRGATPASVCALRLGKPQRGVYVVGHADDFLAD